MIHKFSILLELTFDDESGEYVPPSTREIENKLTSAIYGTVGHLGFESDYHLEVANGSLSNAFGLEI
ncbi:hypothetical protein L0244_38630 [bacterium]|nr:hypothetical protein [bacterium]